MSKKKKVKETKAMVGMEKQEENAHTKPMIRVALPTANPEVILAYLNKHDNAQLVVEKYIESCERIACKESETILAALKIKVAAFYKILLIIAILIIIVLMLVLGITLRGSYDRLGFTISPKQTAKK